jgi:hypothetical protein
MLIYRPVSSGNAIHQGDISIFGRKTPPDRLPQSGPARAAPDLLLLGSQTKAQQVINF